MSRQDDGARSWEEAIPCAGCGQPTNGDQIEETTGGRMHEFCAIRWNEREAAVSECWLCGYPHTANEGGIGDYGACCSDCSMRARRARMEPTRAVDVPCPTCDAKRGRRCTGAPHWIHDERHGAAVDRQQAMFAAMLAGVPYVEPQAPEIEPEQLDLFAEAARA
jgi:hypothetical protein